MAKAWFTLLLLGCAGGPAARAPTLESPLYDRLGGKQAIAAVVDDFVGRVAGDRRINQRFWNADVPNLKLMLFEQICQASGGPCRYSGKDMKTAHAGMNISDREFDALVGDLTASLDRFHVGPAEQRELVAALGALKPEVVRQ